MNICFAISSINWSLTKDVVSIIGTFVAIWIGYSGLQTWKRQLQGTNEYELAKKIYIATYDLQDTIKAARNPMLILNTHDIREGSHSNEIRQIYLNRFNSVLEKRDVLRALWLEAKTIWKDEVSQILIDLDDCIAGLRNAISYHLRMMDSQHLAENYDPDELNRNNEVLYFTSDEDEFSQKVAAAIEPIENFFGPKMRSS